jgi:phage FluMu protein Com
MDGSVTLITQRKLKKGCSNCGAKKKHITPLESFNPNYETNPRYKTYRCDVCNELFRIVKTSYREKKAKDLKTQNELRKEQMEEIQRTMNKK